MPLSDGRARHFGSSVERRLDAHLRRPAAALGAALIMWLPANAGLIAPPNEAAARVLATARTAFGQSDWERLGLLVETGTEYASGLEGRWRRVQELSSGRMHETVDFGVYRLASVWDGREHWRQDHSGGVHALNSAFAKAHDATVLWLVRRGFLQADAGGASLKYLSRREADGRTYETLQAQPPGGQPVEMWFDTSTGLLARTVWVMPTTLMTDRFEDYRSVGGAMVPFKVTSAEEDSSPDTVTVERAEFVKDMSQESFAPPRNPDDSTIANDHTTVPVDYDGEVVVDALINGKGPFSFILDTGGHDILTPEAAQSLGLHGAGAGESGGSGAGKLSEQYTRISRLQLGGVTLIDQSFSIIPLQYSTVERGPKPPLAGILGVELFERFAMELNYRARTLTFRPIANAPSAHGVPVAITFTDDQPIFTAKIDGMAGDNGLDTGNSGALVVQGRWAQTNGLAQRMRTGLVTTSFGAGGMSQNWATRADVEVAGIAFPHVVASYSEDQKGAFSSRTEAGNIGNQVYENFTLTFDYGRNLVWFDPLPGPRPQQFVYSRAGMSAYKASPDSFTVATVVPSAPAAEAGIAAGDEIVAIDGTAAQKLSGWDFRRIVRRPSGTELHLEIMRGGNRRSAIVTLRELLP